MPRKPPPVAPTCFVPSCPADFVGQAGKVAEVLLRKADRSTDSMGDVLHGLQDG